MPDQQLPKLKGYILEDAIGEGGFGKIYRARQSTVERDVAIKVIQPQFANKTDFIRRFEKEAQLVAGLEHLHITPLYDYWRDQNGAYLVMRFMRGGSVRDALNDGGYELIEIARLIEQVATALNYSHEHRIIHRDIKPENILLDEEGNAYLADFGIAKDLMLKTERRTEPGAVVGSLDYLSPEQARGEPVTPRTDIYSLAVVTFELLTGEHPFEEFSSVERLYKHINDPLPLIESLDDHISEDVNAVIQCASAKDPTKRYSNVIAFAEALRKSFKLDQTAPEPAQLEEILTLREQEVLNLLAQGLANREIADKLYITTGTVKWYNKVIFRKLGVHSRVQAVVKARELELILRDNEKPVANKIITTSLTLLDDIKNPYKGLLAFQSSDSALFFGRDSITKKLLARMQETNKHARFLAIVGPSGSGKSSLVRAGVIPALWRGEIPGSDQWFLVDMVPGKAPLDNLEVALTRVLSDRGLNLYEQLTRDSRGLLRIADMILPDDSSELVIVIDQFEEVFSLVEHEDNRQHFLDLLLSASTEPHSRVRVIVTLRADFYDRPLHYPTFGAVLRARMETILPLTVEELTHTIVEPAKYVKTTFEEGLVTQIVSDINYQSGALPLLQYALTELFERRSGRVITWDAYHDIGGAVGALAHQAEELYHELDATAQDIVHQLFLRLVTLGEGTEDTRRRVNQQELISLFDDQDLIEEVIDVFVEHRLLALDNDEQSRQPTVEVAHEAIIREWERLKSWLNDSRTDIRQHRQLARLATEWHEANEDQSFLLRGGRLEQFNIWKEITAIRLTPEEGQYLQTSKKVYTQQQEAEQARQTREANLERHAQQRMRYLVVALVIMLVGAVSVSIFAFDREQRANAAQATSAINASRAQELALINESRVALAEEDTETALAFAMQVNSVDAPSEASQAILAQAGYSPGTVRLFENTTEVWNLAVNAEHGLLLTIPVYDLEKVLYALETGEIIHRFGQGEEGAVPASAGDISANGEVVAYGQVDGVIVLYSVESGEELRRLETNAPNSILDLAFLPDNRRLLVAYSGFDSTGTCEGDLLMWDYQTGDIVLDFDVPSDCIPEIYLSTDGEVAVTGGSVNSTTQSDDHGIISIWDLNTGEELQRLGAGGEGHQRIAISVVMTQDRQMIVSFGADSRLIFWDIVTGEPVQIIENTTSNWSNSFLALSPDERTVGLTSNLNEGKITLYDMQTYEVTNRLESYLDAVYRITFVQDSNHIIVAGHGGYTRLVDLAYGAEIRRTSIQLPEEIRSGAQQEQHVIKRAFSADYERILYTVARFDALPDAADVPAIHYLYDLETGEQLAEYHNEDLFNATGSTFVGTDRIATAFQDGTVIIWDINTGEELQRFTLNVTQLEPQSRFYSERLLVLGPSFDQIQPGKPIVMIDLRSGEVTQFVQDDLVIVYWMLSPDERHLLTTTIDGLILVWDTATGDLLHEFDAHNAGIPARIGDIAPDSETALSFSTGELIHWDIANGEILHRYNVGSSRVVYPASFLSQEIIFRGDEMQLLDIETGTLIRTFSPLDSVVSVRVTPANDLLAFPELNVQLQASEFHWWRLDDQDDLIAWIENNRYIREFTCQERELYNIEPLCGT